ncbi:bifunctional 4-hydroxy-2-oxoglutarate aldolase/2-dehydro-3-deoxy-phosphogluconate aldolase [Streptacidiphilus sp. 4-A2]|nr:bifunctional 4-hydroxy-2-oxoglutarate aldolase/2-dehydro-3-deoxy-phosphogluconate aldolase [Streptacidiphilus sp. 4-A2]
MDVVNRHHTDQGTAESEQQPPDVLSRLGVIGVVPVVVLDDADSAGPLADALLAGGLGCAELTLRTPAAESAVRAMADRSGLLLGVGTVLEADQVERCAAAGARFVVSPGYDDAVVERCRQLGLPVLPGTATATEVLRARRAGLRTVKFFPAETSGGLAALKALAAPFHDMRFVPTGGIGPDNAGDYLRTPAVLAVGGSWMVPRELVRERRWDDIRRLSAQAVQAVAEARAQTVAS